MRFNFKNKKELLFMASGILMLFALAVFFIYSINFLVRNLNAALSADSAKPTSIIRFNIDGLKKLGIIE